MARRFTQSQVALKLNEFIFGSWSPSGDRFVTRGVGGAKVYDTSTGQQLLDLSLPETVLQACSLVTGWFTNINSNDFKIRDSVGCR